jgi:hypothetical protein
VAVLHHFSEDDSIRLFEPHVPRTNPSQPPAVWAIDAEHAPLYWFPRDCPRIAAWPSDQADRNEFERAFCTTAWRLHVMEFAWLKAMESTALYRYDFDASEFEPWADASGQWISHTRVQPIGCGPVGDLLERHRAARIELRLVDSLFPTAEMAASDLWEFSIVRMTNGTANQHPSSVRHLT